MGKMTEAELNADAVREGTYGAVCDVLSVIGSYPMTSEAILDSIRDGVQRAVADYLAKHGLEGLC